MKITSVEANNRKKAFELRTMRETLDYPYAKLALRPTVDNPVADVFPDPETGREAFTYRRESGAEDTVHRDMYVAMFAIQSKNGKTAGIIEATVVTC